MIPSDFSSDLESNALRSFGATWTETNAGNPDPSVYQNSARITDCDGAYVTTAYWSSEDPLTPEGLAELKRSMVGYCGKEYANFAPPPAPAPTPEPPKDPCQLNPEAKGYTDVYTKEYADEQVGCVIYKRAEDYKNRVCDGKAVLTRSAYRTGVTEKSQESGCKSSTGGGGGTGGGGRGGGSSGGGSSGGGGSSSGGSQAGGQTYSDFSGGTTSTGTTGTGSNWSLQPDPAYAGQSGSNPARYPSQLNTSPFSPTGADAWYTDYNSEGYNANDPIMGGSYYAPSGGSPQAFTGNTASDIGIAYQSQQQNYNTYAGAWGGTTSGDAFYGSGAVGGTLSPNTTNPLVSAGQTNEMSSVKQSDGGSAAATEAVDATDVNPEGSSLGWITAAIIAAKIFAV